VSATESQKRATARVEPVSFQSVEGVPVRPWLPAQSVDVTSWTFDGTVYGEPVANRTASTIDDAEPAETGPTVEALAAELESAQAAAVTEQATHAHQIQELQSSYEASAQRFETALASLDQRLSSSAVSLAMLMAEHLLAREAEVDETVLVDNLNRALDRVGPVEHLRIEAHGDDVDRLRVIAPELAKERTGRAIDVVVTASTRLTRGGMLISFDRGVIDASWGSQLGHLGEAVALAFDAERLAAETQSASETSEPVPAQPSPTADPQASADDSSVSGDGESA
jgi:flagellar biosynthesis/type III secretory pathway protein FliH